MSTIVELLEQYPDLFYRGQTWYRGEAFTWTLPSATHIAPPTREHISRVPKTGVALPRAVELLNVYVKYPDADVWRDYLWTGDFDALHQRVYIGGTANGHGMEIHRHLAITSRWAQPVFP